MIDCAAVMVLWSAWQPSTLATQVAVVVAHLVERLLPAPEVRGSNPLMVCLGLEPGVAGWKAQTNPMSYGGTPNLVTSQHLTN